MHSRLTAQLDALASARKSNINSAISADCTTAWLVPPPFSPPPPPSPSSSRSRVASRAAAREFPQKASSRASARNYRLFTALAVLLISDYHKLLTDHSARKTGSCPQRRGHARKEINERPFSSNVSKRAPARCYCLSFPYDEDERSASARSSSHAPYCPAKEGSEHLRSKA